MKWLLLFTFAFSGLTFAETLKERQTKAEMLERVQSLIVKAEEGREALDNEDVVLACKKVEEIFEILPKHLVAIGSKMDLFDKNVIKMERETKVYLVTIHKTNNVCKSGKDSENLDIEEADRNLKVMYKAFKKQKKRIKKSDTNYENTYNYYYEF